MERLQQQRRALGSAAIFTLMAGDAAAGNEQFAKLWHQTDEFEARFSRFIETSELVQLNRAAGKKFACSKDMKAILVVARQWSQQTQGIFNPFVLPKLFQAGYTTSFESSVSAPPAPSATRFALIDELEIGDDWVRIPADAAIDLGGIGKGYLLDQLAGSLDSQVDSYWLSLGGDVVGRGYDVDQSPWKIGVAHPKNDAQIVAIGIMQTSSRWAMATSGINKRHGTYNKKSWHHLIDPRTGMSSTSDVVTATVVGNSAVAADVLASVVVILGNAKGRKLLVQSALDGSLIQTSSETKMFSSNMVRWQKGNV